MGLHMTKNKYKLGQKLLRMVETLQIKYYAQLKKKFGITKRLKCDSEQDLVTVENLQNAFLI